MFLRKVCSPLLFTAFAMALTLGFLTWGDAQAASPAAAQESTLQQTMPMTGTMQGMAGGAMPMQPGVGNQDGMGQMMAHMARMQRMMARMQRMMAGSMMSDSMPMTGTMPMTDTMPMMGMMQGDMAEMMNMMGEMQEMMTEMQGMMADEMMSRGAAMGGMMQGQPMPGQQMPGGMMTQMPMMPMMGTMILVAPMPMMHGMNMGGMMSQMPMMQGMNMGDMMGQMPMMQGMGGMMGQTTPQIGASASAPSEAAPTNAQSGALGAIEVKVTPPDLSNIQGDTIDFTVDLNATDADLKIDLAKLATLRIGEHEMAAAAWEVAFDHGHHVNGVLKFPAHMQGAVESAELIITDPVGGDELTLTWPPTP